MKPQLNFYRVRTPDVRSIGYFRTHIDEIYEKKKYLVHHHGLGLWFWSIHFKYGKLHTR